MWIFLNNAFLSIVKNQNDASKLLVRARIAGDIERVFPGVRVEHTSRADYAWRAAIDRSQVSAKLAQLADGIDYPNFKNSVREDRRHDAYMSVWQDMLILQQEEKPKKKVGRPGAPEEHIAREFEYTKIVNTEGLSNKKAIEKVADKNHRSPETIRSSLKSFKKWRKELYDSRNSAYRESIGEHQKKNDNEK